MQMSKSICAILFSLCSVGAALADGLTSTNYSAAQIKTGNRNASLGPEAAFFNPAGTVWGKDGFSLEASNMMAPYTEDEISDSLLGTYTKESTSWLFPALNMCWKQGKLAVFSSIAPSKAGGAGDLEDGAPTLAWAAASGVASALIAIDPSLFAVQLGSIASGDFTVDQTASGSTGSVGASLGAAYAVNSWLSAAVAARYVYQWNHLEAEINGLTIGGTNYLTSSVELDMDQTGSCWGLVAGVDIRPSKRLTICNTVQYYTELEMETSINDGKNGGGLYEDGATSIETYSPEWSIGISYELIPGVLVTADSNLFFNCFVETDFEDDYEEFAWNGGAGIEWQTTETLNLGTGFTYSPVSQTSASQTDLNYSNSKLWCNVGATWEVLTGLKLTVALQTAIDTDEAEGTGSSGESQSYSTSSRPWTIAVGVAWLF